VFYVSIYTYHLPEESAGLFLVWQIVFDAQNDKKLVLRMLQAQMRKTKLPKDFLADVRWRSKGLG